MDSPTPMISDRALYLDEAGTTVLEESFETRTAGRVLAWRGGEIPAAEVQRLGLQMVEGRVVQGGALIPGEPAVGLPSIPLPDPSTAPSMPGVSAEPPAPDTPPAPDPGGE